jgi:protein tyrosine/serine phosphatase
MKTRIRWLRWAPLVLVGMLAAALVWDYGVQKNFDTVVPGKVYRSGQPTEGQLGEWIREYGLRGILSLRFGVPAYEAELAERYGVKLYHVPFSATTGLKKGQWEKIKTILTDESNLPLLIHCYGGGDRSGIVTAFYRVEIQDWPVEKAIREMIFHYHIPLRYPALERQLREHFRDESGETSAGQAPAARAG